MSSPARSMISPRMQNATAGPRPRRLLAALVTSTMAHAILALMLVFDVAGIAGGLGLGVGPGFGLGAGGGAGLGEKKRREIFSLQDLPEPVPPRDPAVDDTLKQLLAAAPPQAAAVPQPAQPRST